MLDTATTEAMYSKSEWAALGAALADAEAGDGNALLALADSYNQRNPDGTYNSIYQSCQVIRCASGSLTVPGRPGGAARPDQGGGPALRPHHDASTISTTTARYLFHGPQKLYAPSYSGTAPILVVGGINDPATPIRWAEELTAELGPERDAAHLLRRGPRRDPVLDVRRRRPRRRRSVT